MKIDGKTIPRSQLKVVDITYLPGSDETIGFALQDARGRTIGASVSYWIATVTEIDSRNLTRAVHLREGIPGTFYVFRAQPLRDGSPHGQYREEWFTTTDLRATGVRRYFEKARERARKLAAAAEQESLRGTRYREGGKGVG